MDKTGNNQEQDDNQENKSSPSVDYYNKMF